MGSTISNESPTTEPPQKHFTGTKSSPSILVLFMHKICLTRMEASSLLQCIITEKQSNQINTL